MNGLPATYLVAIAYDGSDFNGWSRQPKKRTVEGEITRILQRVFHFAISIDGSSRTDSGVHAFNQYFTFSLPVTITLERLKTVLKQNFNNDIKIMDVKQVNHEYDLRSHVNSKEYHYYINTGSINPFKIKYQFQYGNELDPKKLQAAFDCFIGQHYFYNFSGLSSEDKKSPYRTILAIVVKKTNNEIIISIKGRGFLRYQIRYLIAAAIKYCENKISLNEIVSYLQPTTKQKFPLGKVPASGLYLFKTTLSN